MYFNIIFFYYFIMRKSIKRKSIKRKSIKRKSIKRKRNTKTGGGDDLSRFSVGTRVKFIKGMLKDLTGNIDSIDNDKHEYNIRLDGDHEGITINIAESILLDQINTINN